jgi:glycine hydroxymethyltransferase
MKEKEMERIGNLIADVLAAPSDASVQRRVETEVRALCDAFPLYASRLGAYAKG